MKPSRYYVDFESKALTAAVLKRNPDFYLNYDVTAVADTVDAGEDLDTATALLRKIAASDGGWAQLWERTNILGTVDSDGITHWDFDDELVIDSGDVDGNRATA